MLLVVICTVPTLTGCEQADTDEIDQRQAVSNASVSPNSTPRKRDKVITLVADVWLPYSGDAETDTFGFMLDIAIFAFEKHGYTIEYLNVPWARAIRGTRAGTYDGIVGAGPTETPDFIFPEYELGLPVHTFYVMQGSTWKYTGLDSLQQLTLGVIRDYSYGTLFADYIQPNENDSNRIQIVSVDEALSNNIKKLQTGRIDVLVEDPTAFQYYLHMTKTPNNFTTAGVYGEEKVYIAFSPAHEDALAYAQILSRAMEELRDTGKLATILAAYGVQDWKE